MQEDTHFRVMRLIESRPEISQRELAEALGVSLGKANYCLRALMDKGWIKARNFKNSNDKRAYMYLLTPKGVDNKAKITMRFLNRKIQEYEQLRAEIRELRREVGGDGHDA